MFNMIVRLGPAACLLAVAACASRYGDRPLDVSAPLRGNATVPAVVFQATPPSDPVAKPKTAAVDEVVVAAAAPARDRGKRKTTRAGEARPIAAAPSRADAGGFQTLTTYQNQGLNAYDRVQIEGQKLCALRGD